MTHTDVIREERAEVDRQIAATTRLRDSQRVNSAHAELFQLRIDALTRLLLWCDEVIPQLAVLDERERVARSSLRDATSRLNFAENVESDKVARARHAAAVLSLPGLVCVLVGALGDPPWWVLTAGILLTLLAGGLFGWSLWWLSSNTDTCQDAQNLAQDILDDIAAQRDLLLRGRAATTQEPADPVTIVQEIPAAQRTLALPSRTER